MQFESVNDVLDFAIKNEQEAFSFYTDLAAKMDNAATRKTFEGYAQEEKGHEAKLRAIKEGKQLEPAANEVLDLKLSDYLVKEVPSSAMDYQDALILAMKKEKAAFMLYSDLAASTSDSSLRSTFLALAQEEAKHKLRFEIEYDEKVLREN
jgi:rubrerythrin